MNLNPEETAVVIYLFTVPEYQNNGYAKEIIDTIAIHMKKRFMKVQHLIRTTSSEKNKKLYLSYGAKIHTINKENRFLTAARIVDDFYFSY